MEEAATVKGPWEDIDGKAPAGEPITGCIGEDTDRGLDVLHTCSMTACTKGNSDESKGRHTAARLSAQLPVGWHSGDALCTGLL